MTSETEDRQRGWVVTAADCEALLRKYRRLAILRTARDAGWAGDGTMTAPSLPVTPRTTLRALAAEFPGALRELDVLGLPEIEKRIDQLEKRIGTLPGYGDAGETTVIPFPIPDGDRDGDDDWIPWIVAYHAVMRAAFAVKRARGPMGAAPATALSDLIATADPGSRGGVFDESFVRAVVNPPSGRLAVVVLTTLSRHFGTPAAQISQRLFPARRPPPYGWPP